MAVCRKCGCTKFNISAGIEGYEGLCPDCFYQSLMDEFTWIMFKDANGKSWQVWQDPDDEILIRAPGARDFHAHCQLSSL